MMNNFRFLFVISIVFLVLSCKQSKEEKTQKNKSTIQVQIEESLVEKSHDISEIDSIRAFINKSYLIAKKIDDTPEIEDLKNVNISGCVPCDMTYLVYLNSQKDYSIEEVKKLLCLDDNDKCVDNAEFSQFYNEIVYKVFKREQHDFTDKQLKELLKDDELIEELVQPVNDNTDISLLDALKQDALNPND